MQIDRDLHILKICSFLLGSQSEHRYNLNKAEEETFSYSRPSFLLNISDALHAESYNLLSLSP